MSRIAPMNLRSRMGIFRSIAPTPARRYGPRHSCPNGGVRTPFRHARARANFGREWTLANLQVSLDVKVLLQTCREVVGPSDPHWRQTNEPMTSLAPSSATRGRAVRLWLLAVAALMFVTVVVGGTTRLTESGLSIVEWKPVTGMVPPLDAPAWEAEFDKYKAIPQYRERNPGMSLDDFKTIYWWEWTHRLLARVVGAAFLLPFLWFLWRGEIEANLRG